jgi:hypothetical protein
MGTKLHLVKVRINKQGYDDHGRQWGVGVPLYHAWSDEGTFLESYVRAYTRERAKQSFPGHKFYR